MREYKFRAYDTVDKVMKNFCCGIFNRVPDKMENLSELMQYTGLEDVNNKEIYDGDIVRCYELTETKEEEFVSEVVWDDDGFVVYDEFGIGVPLSVYTKPRSAPPYYGLEVVGNVYERPIGEVDLIVQGLVTK